MFSRMYELEEGTERYSRYYSEHPKMEQRDRELRTAGGGVFASREAEQRQIDAVFSLIADLRAFAGHYPQSQKTELSVVDMDPEEAAGRLKKSAGRLGAFKSGICKTDESWAYSRRGRGDNYGRPVDEVLPCTFVLAFEMDEAEINRAPAVEQSVEVVLSYYRAASAALALKRIINSWGYSARAHIDGQSELILPPAAEAAGIGSIGLHGVLVSKEYGPRIRLAAVTTDMPLAEDPPSHFKVRNFCKNCGKCAATCPSMSIRAFSDYKDGERFSIDHESCFGLWREMSTDCGVCLAVCPFSHPGRDRASGRGEAGFLKDFMFGQKD